MYEDFYERINAFVRKTLNGYIPRTSGEKTIHDPIWGSVLYYGWEIQVIDSPLLQRLRDIGQLGMADLTYTAARHSRFEHSLGTAAVAGRMLSALKERYRKDNKIVITDEDVYKIRLAGILHDVGHCFFSHLSEGVYSSMKEFRDVYDHSRKEIGEGVKPKGHEFFSYSIITSDAFAEFFFEYIDFPGKTKDIQWTKKLLREVANTVIGASNVSADGTVLEYMTAIINGEFDADKLDYTQRDSYTAGIAMTYGVERFLMKLIINENEENGVKTLRLAIDADSLSTVEELIFNRNLLYVYMYRHQKVLAVEACMRDIIYGMQNAGYMKHPCDFLGYTDSDIENLIKSDEKPFEFAENVTLGTLVENIRLRRLPKRCWEISSEKILDGYSPSLQESVAERFAALPDREKTAERFIEFVEEYNNSSKKYYLIDKIKDLLSFAGELEYGKYIEIRRKYCDILAEKYEKAGRKAEFTPLDIHIVIPKYSASKTLFPLVYKDGRTRSTDSVKYISDWTESFTAEKWKGYIFCSDSVDRTLAKEAAEEFFAAMPSK